MGRRNCSFALDPILDLVNADHELHKNLSLALFSLEKRSKFAQIYHHEVIQCISESKLELERAGLNITDSGKILPNRTYYEANLFAYVQNLHAILDSLPYIVFLLIGKLSFRKPNGKAKTISGGSCAWSDDFMNAVSETFPNDKKLNRRLIRLYKDRDFLILKGLVNQSKHQHITRIINDSQTLRFERIDFFDSPSSGQRKTLENIDALPLIIKWNNKFFPRIFIIIWTLYLTRKSM